MAFETILTGGGIILPQHASDFQSILSRFTATPQIWISNMGKYMEARIFVDLARYFLTSKAWFDGIDGHIPVTLGVIRHPHKNTINDKISRSAKGWQDKIV